MNIKCGHCKGHHETVADVRTCGGHPASAEARRPGPLWGWNDRMVATMAKPGPATPGMYRWHGQVYKVVLAVHGSGRPYAKRLDKVADGRYEFVMAPGIVGHLSQADRMTADEAKAFGQLTGVCVRCAAQLTDEASIQRGMGPVCATKI